MAVHKVPLDVEADDKFLGPLSFKQFLFGGGAILFGYLTFVGFTSALWPIGFFFLIPTIIGVVFAFPWSKEQPSELFLASRIRFYIKPRKRIWDQSGMKHLVQITAPKKIVHEMTDGLNQTEVRSRFNALASMVDSRGWAVKHATASAGIGAPEPASDRLVTPDTSIPTEQEAVLQSTPDVLDETNSTIAKQFDSMIEKSTVAQKSAARDIVAQARKDQAINQTTDQSNATNSEQNFWFDTNQPQPASTIQPTTPSAMLPTVQRTTAAQNKSLLTEEELLAKAYEKQRRDALQTGVKHGTTVNPDGSILQAGGHIQDEAGGQSSVSSNVPANNSATSDDNNSATVQQPVSQPADDPTTTQPSVPPIPTSVADNTTITQQPAPYTVPEMPQHAQYQAPDPPVTKNHNPDILELAQSNDLNIETLARQAHKNDGGEVVISLH